MSLQQAGLELVAAGAAAYISDINRAEGATKQFVGGLDAAAGGMSSTQSIIAGATAGITASVVDGMAQAAGAVASFIGDGISQAGEFEAGINTLAAVTGSALADAGYSFDDVRGKALQLGADTKYSAQEALAAMTELAKGGLPIEQVMGEATDATLNLAAAAGVDLANAAELVASQFAIWNDTGVTVTNVADLLTQAANASKVGVEDLSLGLANSGTAAKVAGVEFDDLVQTMGMIAPGFASAADAGTSLKTFLSRLIPTTKPATAAMIELGLATEEGKSRFYDAQGSFIGMEEAAHLLAEATEDLSEEQKSLALNTIFGSDAVRAAALIADAGATGFTAFGDAMATAGTAAETAAMMNQGYDASMQALSGSVDTLKIVIGSALLPILTLLVGYVTEGVNVATTFAQAVMGSSAAFEGLSPQLQAAVTNVQGFIGTAQELLAAAQPVADLLVANWQPALGAVAAVIGAAVLPALASFVVAVAPVVAAVGVAIAIGTALYNAWQTDFMGIQGITASALTAVQGVITTVLGVVSTFWAENGAQIVAFTGEAWTQIQEIVGTIAAGVAEIISNVFGGIAGFIGEHGDEIQSILSFAWNSIQNIIELALDVIQGVTNTVLGVLTGDWEQAAGGIEQIVGGLGTFLEGQFNNIVALIEGIGPSVLSAAESVGNAIVDGIAGGISSAAGAIADAARNAAQSALDAAKDLLGIHSPSTAFKGVGRDADYGLAEGFTAYASVPMGAAEQVAAATVAAASTAETRVAGPVTNYSYNSASYGGSVSYHIDARGSTLSEAQIEAAFSRALGARTGRADRLARIGGGAG